MEMNISSEYIEGFVDGEGSFTLSTFSFVFGKQKKKELFAFFGTAIFLFWFSEFHVSVWGC
jgi:hypothetical protein